MKLTLQDKLALALTSWGSQRRMAGAMGISHQKLGRWLREGQADGVKAIPREAQAAIDTVFAIHRDIAKQTARAQGLPFDPKAPVFLERKPRRDGQLGDRVFAEHTHFIRSGLRQEVVWSAQQSRRFIGVSVRSTVDLQRYARRIAQDEHRKRRHTGISVAQLTEYVQAGLERREAREGARKLTEQVSPGAIYTKYSNISPMMGNRVDAVDEVESRLRQKHEPAATAVDPKTGKARDIPGTRLADTLLFQLLPAKNEPNRTPTRKAKPPAPAKPRRR